MKRKIQKTLAWLLMLALVVTVLPFGALAAAPEDKTIIDTTKPGSITVTKYQTVNISTGSTPTHTGNATGTTNDAVTDTSYKPLNGATFKLFKIADADAVEKYYNGMDNAAYTLKDAANNDRFVYDSDTDTATFDGQPATLIDTKTTAGTDVNAGKCTFPGLSVGIYVLKEVTAPDQITTPLAETCLISIPMVNTATSSNNGNAEWMYDVYVYPKNHESTGTLELTKWDQNDLAFNNSRIATFELYKKEFQADGSLPTGDWTPVTSTSSDGTTETLLTLTTGDDGKIILANLPANLYGTQYKLVEVSAPNGFIVNKTPLYFKVTTDNKITWNLTENDPTGLNNENTGVVGTPTEETGPKLSVTLRNEQLSLTKHVQKNGGTEWKTDEQYRLDDEITYRLIAYVPRNVTEIAYEIKDLPQIGITDSALSTDYTVTYGATKDSCTTPLTGDGYTWSTIDATGTNGQGFKLTLNDNTAAGSFIQIIYKAHFNDKAVIAGDGNVNTATLTYSKFIGGSDDKYTITDEARVYTYQYQITKYKDSATAGNELATGETVSFQLLDKNKNLIDVIKISDGVYRVALSTETGLETMTTGDQGKLQIQGLENETYYLKETKTIDNYNLLSKPFEIKLDVTRNTNWTPDGVYKADGQVVKTYDKTTFDVTNAMGTGTIVNKKGFVLPQTGSMGYLLFCAVGIVLIAGGTMLIFGGRKKKIR
ncbi:MAG: SpaH/EbpB family LPXTG-anchored major pilin [Firmicutes bacterium]|nr:SpaH/EbpB family LPXTG-anchored major pilin [Bacillota bacterium]MDY6160038.1 SpaH/EbpB family LPXTG-anchored major pilin [Candidatus Faecousia sp.]